MINSASEIHEVRIADITLVGRERDAWRAPSSTRAMSIASYRARMGRDTIRLDPVAFRILTFLAAAPYRAFTRRRIAEAVSSRRHPVAEESLDGHIRLLRQQLGFFRDYVQTVPYIGYRFKA